MSRKDSSQLQVPLRRQAITKRHPSYILNTSAKTSGFAGLFADKEYEDVEKFFGDLPGYAPTPLRHVDHLARELSLGRLSIKDESSRMGLPAFKILGVQYAVHRLISEGSITKNSVLVCATDGNHGRALAHIAHLYGLKSHVFIHKGAAPARVDTIADEGAQITIVDGNYDFSVRQASKAAERPNGVLISDTAWPGYETVPRYIMAGYTMLMAEAAQQWTDVPDVVIVQAGVGGLACAVVSWLAHRFSSAGPRVVAAEPQTAACVLESMRAGKRKVVRGSLSTIMAGLSCGTVSSLAWPILEAGLHASMSISDVECIRAIRRLAQPGGQDPQMPAGESGACGLAALLVILSDREFRVLKKSLDLGPKSHVFLINTEGITDPENSASYLPA